MIKTFFVCSLLYLFANAFYCDEDLAKAFECALLDSQSKIEEEVKSKQYAVSKFSDCFMNPQYYKYPTLSVGGTLYEVLTKKKVNVGIAHLDPFSTLFQHIVNVTYTRMSEKYKYNNIEIVFHDYNNADSLFNDLTYGVIHTAYPGLSWEGQLEIDHHKIRRVCASRAFEFRVSVFSESSSISSATQLIAAAKRAPDHTIIVSTLEEGKILQERFGLKYTIIKGNDRTRVDAFKRNPTKFFAVVRHERADRTTDKRLGLHSFDLGYQIPLPIFFRRESTSDFIETKERPYDVGNKDLLSVFDAAITEVQDTPNEFDWGDQKLATVADCTFLLSKYPPLSKIKGKLQKVLTSNETLVLGYVTEHSKPFVVTGTKDLAQYHNPVVLPSDGWIHIPDREKGLGAYGLLVDLERAIVKKISDHYHLAKPFQIQQKIYTSSEDVFAALENGEIDATSLTFSAGSQYHGSPRRWKFLYSCSGAAYKLSFFLDVKHSKTIKTFADLSTYISKLMPDSIPLKILVGTSRLSTVILELLYEPLFANSTFHYVDIMVEEDPDIAFSKVLNKTDPVFMYLPRYIGRVPHRYSNRVYAITAASSVPVTMFFRRDKIFYKDALEKENTYSSAAEKKKSEDFHVITTSTDKTLFVVWFLFALIGIVIIVVTVRLCFSPVKRSALVKVDEEIDQSSSSFLKKQTKDKLEKRRAVLGEE